MKTKFSDDCGRRTPVHGSVCVTPALSHHSFAMYDQTKTVMLTGVAYQFVAQANHAETPLLSDRARRQDWPRTKTGSTSIGASKWRAPRPWRSKALRRPRSE